MGLGQNTQALIVIASHLHIAVFIISTAKANITITTNFETLVDTYCSAQRDYRMLAAGGSGNNGFKKEPHKTHGKSQRSSRGTSSATQPPIFPECPEHTLVQPALKEDSSIPIYKPSHSPGALSKNTDPPVFRAWSIWCQKQQRRQLQQQQKEQLFF